MTQKTALISVFDKTGIVDFARALIALGWRIISSGGTAKVLREADISVTDVAEISGLPAILGHRVVTLVPHIHGGLLATEEMRPELERLGYPWIDLVCVDLYPLEAEIAREGATRESVIEKTDIGGPTLIRSAAKGRRIVIVDPTDRNRVLEWLKTGEPDRENICNSLAAKAEGIIARYCLASARYHSDGTIDGMIGTQVAACKYGENAWQAPAGLSSTGTNDPLALDRFTLVEGNTPSYNNFCDLDRPLQTMTHAVATWHENWGTIPWIAVGVKHGNPCGAAIGDETTTVLRRMLEGDPLAIHGGLVITNFPLKGMHGQILRTWSMQGDSKRILDGVIAPSFSEGAQEELGRKHGKCRMIANPALAELDTTSLDHAPRFRYVRGGFLRQPNYTFVLDFKNPNLECVGEMPAAPERRNLVLAWAVGSTSNSNTITLVKNGMLIGNGVGQQDRVGAAELAIARARRSGHDIRGAVAYSDSFFPFPDGPKILIDAGVRVILATETPKPHEEVRAICRQNDVALVLLPDTEARGFFGH